MTDRHDRDRHESETDRSASSAATDETVRRDTRRILSEIAGEVDLTDPFAAAVRATRMPMIITDPRHNDNPIIFVNDAFCCLTGYDRDEIVGRNCRFLQGPGTNPDDVARIRQAVTAREKIEIAIYNYRKDGTPFWNQLRLAPVKDAKGEVAYFFASQYDVTSDFAQVTRLKGENSLLASKHALSRERLHASQERFTTVLEAIDTAFAVVEVRFDSDDRPVDYRFLEANPAFERQAGVNLRGKWVTEFAPDLERFWFETYGRVALTGEPASFENYAQGFERWFDVRAIRIGDPADRQIAIFFNDTTERKRVEHALRESEMRFRRMANHAPVMMWITDAKGDCIYLNHPWYAYTGQTEAEGLGLGWLDAVHPEDRGWSGDTFLKANAARKPFRLEYRLKGDDGQYRWFIDAAQPRLDEDGSFHGYIGSVTDIHDRTIAEQRLAETTRRLDAILNNTTQAIFLMDERQQCSYMNAAAERLTGYTLTETQGRALHDVVHHTRPDGSPYPLCECPIDQAFPENNQEQGEEVFIHKNGFFYPVGFTASPIRDEHGQPIGTVIEARNIEEELRAKAALEAFNITLEQRVEEEIAKRVTLEEALRQSQKMEAV